MDSRVVLFLVLSLVIIFSYPYILMKFGLATPDSQTTQQGEKGKALPSAKTAPGEKNASSTLTALPSVASEEGHAAPLLESPLPPERLKVIESDLYRVVLSSRGGVVKEWGLKKYTRKDEKGITQPIPLLASSATVLPLAMTSPKDALFWDYSLNETKLELNKDHPTGTVVMKATLPDGRSLTKEVTFYHDHYHLDLAITASGFPEYDLALGSNFGITNWERTMGSAAGAISMIDGKVVSERPTQETITHDTGVTWFGLSDTYFMSALIPIPPQGKKEADHGTLFIQERGEHDFVTSIKMPVRDAQTYKFILYAGPKEYDRLVKYPHFLDEAIDFGWFIYGSWLPVRLVAKPLFYILRFLYGVTQNYGWAIILLTALLKIVFYPVTQKSLVAMKQMATLQPKVAQIREKWADNKEKMNKELMNLYRESGANPMGGCLPMLLQMPVFIALFNILYMTIDLKNAPFIFWISDLSIKDPYYVLPIIMGGTMILQQMTQPSTMDPTQAKIMMFMPVIYTFFFLSFPSGLVLYWLVNNVLSIAQQYWATKRA